MGAVSRMTRSSTHTAVICAQTPPDNKLRAGGGWTLVPADGVVAYVARGGSRAELGESGGCRGGVGVGDGGGEDELGGGERLGWWRRPLSGKLRGVGVIG